MVAAVVKKSRLLLVKKPKLLLGLVDRFRWAFFLRLSVENFRWVFRLNLSMGFHVGHQ